MKRLISILIAAVFLTTSVLAQASSFEPHEPGQEPAFIDDADDMQNPDESEGNETKPEDDASKEADDSLINEDTGAEEPNDSDSTGPIPSDAETDDMNAEEEAEEEEPEAEAQMLPENMRMAATTGAGLQAEIDGANDGDIIEIGNDIVLSAPLRIDKNLTFRSLAPDGPATIFTEGNIRHMDITGSDVKLVFEDVILDGRPDAAGAAVGGGVVSQANLTLEGAVIQHCTFLGNGGGISAKNVDLTLRNVNLNYNTARRNGMNNYNAGLGGGVYAEGNVNVKVEGNCIFAYNTAGQLIQNADAHYGGGAIYVTNGVDLELTANAGETILFEKNTGLRGGAIHNYGSRPASLSIFANGGRILFRENSANLYAYSSYGGAISTSVSSAGGMDSEIRAAAGGTIEFTNNHTARGGGAIFQDGMNNAHSEMRIIAESDADILFDSNSADNERTGAVGGALYLVPTHTQTNIDASGGSIRFSNNTAKTGGGAISTASAASWTAFNNVTNANLMENLVIEGAEFRGNKAGDGGYLWNNYPTLEQKYAANIKNVVLEPFYENAYNNHDIHINIGSLAYLAAYLLNNGTDDMHYAEMVVSGTRLTPPSAPVWLGTIFAGWTTVRDSEVYFDFNSPITSDITLYAFWSGFTVAYHPNGRLGSTYEIPVEEQEEHRILSATDAELDYTNAGYAFTGWNTEADGSGTQYNPRAGLHVTAPRILYAQWKPGAQATELVQKCAAYEELLDYLNHLKHGDKVAIVLTGDIAVPTGDSVNNPTLLHIQNGVRVTLTDDGSPRTLRFDGRPLGMLVVDEGGELIIEETEQGALIFDGSYSYTDDLDKPNAGDRGYFVTVNGAATIESGTFQNMVALQANGVGAIYVCGEEAKLTMNGGLITKTKLHNCAYSAPVLVRELGEFEMNGGEITGNEADELDVKGSNITAGGVMLMYDSMHISSTEWYWVADVSFTMNGGKIAENLGWYGGVALYNYAPVDIDGFFSAYLEIYPETWMTFIMNGGEISGNAAEMEGGGLAVIGNAQVKIDGGRITGNSALYGGGISLNNLYDRVKNYPQVESKEWWADICNASFSMTDGLIADNEAAYFGGGIYAESMDAHIRGGNILENGAGIDGGGIFIPYDGIIEIINGMPIEKNAAGRNGGGIWLAGELLMAEAYVDNNTAAENGGGLYIAEDVSFVADDGLVIKNNKAGGHGGGIYASDELKLTAKVQITNNTANAQIVPAGRRAAGMSGNGILPLNMRGMSLDLQSEAEEAAGNGGGIYLAKGSLAISDGVSVTENTADNGGGIYLHTEVQAAEITGTAESSIDIAGNKARKDGGGIYTHAYDRLKLKYVSFAKNAAQTAAIWDLDNPSDADRENAEIHRANIAETSYTEHIPAFTNAYSNYDVNYHAEEMPIDTVTVTYKSNGGMGADVTDTVEKGAVYTIKKREDIGFTRAGFTFKGWTDEAGGTSVNPDFDPGKALALQEGLILYAVWSENTGGGGSSGSTTYQVIYHSTYSRDTRTERYRSGTQVTVKDEMFGYPDDVTFEGWSTEAGGSVVYRPDATFAMPSKDVHLYAVFAEIPEPENLLNKDDHYAYVIGYPDGRVQPDGNITRAEVATIYFRLLKDDVREENLRRTNPFGDVRSGDWFNTAVSTLCHLGILEGSDGNFRPNEPITRAELAVIAVRFDKSEAAPSRSFGDITGHWAENSIRRAVTLGWVEGYPDGTFRPDFFITRAEMMALTNRVLERHIDREEDMAEGAMLWPDNPAHEWFFFDVEEATNSHGYDRDEQNQEHWNRLHENRDWTVYEK